MHDGEVTCNKCGWVHFQVSREYAENQVRNFNAFYDRLDAKGKSNYAGHSNIENYETCRGFRCGENYKNFRGTNPGDCPPGCTTNPIINRRD